MLRLCATSRAACVAALLALGALAPGCAADPPAPRTVAPTAAGAAAPPADTATTGPPRRIATH